MGYKMEVVEKVERKERNLRYRWVFSNLLVGILLVVYLREGIRGIKDFREAEIHVIVYTMIVIYNMLITKYRQYQFYEVIGELDYEWGTDIEGMTDADIERLKEI